MSATALILGVKVLFVAVVAGGVLLRLAQATGDGVEGELRNLTTAAEDWVLGVVNILYIAGLEKQYIDLNEVAYYHDTTLQRSASDTSRITPYAEHRLKAFSGPLSGL